MVTCLCELKTRTDRLVIKSFCDMSHLLWVTRITSTMTVGGTGVFNASLSFVYGSAGATRYLVAGRRIEINLVAITLAIGRA